jgi:hypothetical protein
MAAFANGDLAKARELFTGIQQDAETPPDLWVRSGLMISLIDGRLPAPTAEASSETPAAAEAEGPAEAPRPEGEEGAPDASAPAGAGAQDAIPPQ